MWFKIHPSKRIRRDIQYPFAPYLRREFFLIHKLTVLYINHLPSHCLLMLYRQISICTLLCAPTNTAVDKLQILYNKLPSSFLILPVRLALKDFISKHLIWVLSGLYQHRPDLENPHSRDMGTLEKPFESNLYIASFLFCRRDLPASLPHGLYKTLQSYLQLRIDASVFCLFEKDDWGMSSSFIREKIYMNRGDASQCQHSEWSFGP